jgi:tetratricopeptide (TPR) repeat protein
VRADSERYDREAEDVFAVQDEIAAGVVEAVKSRLAPGDRAVRARSQVKNLEAYRHYLKGRHFRYSRNDHASAVGSFREAVALDPGHAPSWVGIAETLVLSAIYELRQSLPAFAEARKALATAAQLQGGVIHFCLREWRASETAIQRALELEPGHTQARPWLGLILGCGLCLAYDGLLDEAIALFEKGAALSRRGPFFVGLLGWGLAKAGRNDEARAILEELRNRPSPEPGSPAPAVAPEAWLLTQLGEMDAAWRIMEQARDEGQGMATFIRLPGLERLRADARYPGFMRSLNLEP